MLSRVNQDLSRPKNVDRKKIASEYFKLVSLGKFKEGARFFAQDCKTHNPFIAGNIETLIDAMIAASKDIGAQNTNTSFEVKHILADGDFVAVYTVLLSAKSKPSEGGLRQVHLFRFKGEKIVEYWDVTQQVLANMPNASEAF